MRFNGSKLLAFLFLLEICLIGPCMAESDVHHFYVNLMGSTEVQHLALQTAYSYPIPLKNHHVAVYAYYLLGLPPQDPKVLVPGYYFEARYPSAEIVKFRPFSADDLKIPLANDGTTLGTVSLPPEYLQMNYDEFSRREDKFSEVYSQAISNYFSDDTLDAASAKQVLEELPIFAKKPLVPLFRETNPDFFAWLEKNAARQ